MTSPLYDIDLERRCVAALLRRPSLLSVVDDLAVADLVDFHAIETLSAIRNLQASGVTITVEAVRAERLALGHEAAKRMPPGYPPSWLDSIVATALPDDPPVAEWASEIHQLAFLRESAVEAEETTTRIEDEIDEFALRDVDPPKLTIVRDDSPAVPRAPSPPRDADWMSLLLVKENRSPKKAYHNTAVFVRLHPEFRGRWSYDLMTKGPWLGGAPMLPEVVHYIRAQADCRLGYTPSPSDVEAALLAAAKEKPFHPIEQYLRSITWDGVPRLSTMAADYLATDDPLHAEMVRKFMIGAVARVLWPGCKLDTALMLVGEQAYRKSTFLAVLGGKWHADTYIDITNKDGYQQLHSAWIYELSELENVVSGARESRLKAWITSTTDRFRAPYAKEMVPHPRSCVICGTTNRRQFLTDISGSRRFWIILVCEVIPHDKLAHNRDQLWAEALHAAESGEMWWLDGDADRNRELTNRQFEEDDSWIDPISGYLSSPRITQVTITEVLEQAIKLDVGRHDRWAQMRASKILKSAGWIRKRTGKNHTWNYVRPDPTSQLGLDAVETDVRT